MPRSGTLRRTRHPLTEEELAAGFAQLTSGVWRAKEARPFAKLVKAAPAIAAPYLVQRLVHGNSKERELAGALLSLVRGPRAVLPLRDVLKDRGLAESARAAAGSVLELLGELEEWPETGPFSNPEELVQHALKEVLDRSAQPPFREQFLASLEEDDAEGRAEMLTALAETKDARVLRLLLPLLYNRRPRTILAAITALELLGHPNAILPLRELAEGDPDPRVRREARAVFGRLYMRASAAQDAPSTLSFSLFKTCITLIDQNGDQAVVIARGNWQQAGDPTLTNAAPVPPAYLTVFTALVNDREGVRSCYGVDRMTPEELHQLLAQFNRNGLSPVESDIAACRSAIEAARRLSLKRRLRLPPELELWSEVIDAPPESAPEQLALWEPPAEAERLLGLVPHTGALFTTPEFRQWFFPLSTVWPYVDEWYTGTIRQQNGEPGQQALEQLLATAAKELFDDDLRRVFSARLSKQALLLKSLGKLESAQLSAAAALGLDPQRGVHLSAHPFVRGMLLSSFLNAGLRPPQPRLFPEDWA